MEKYNKIKGIDIFNSIKDDLKKPYFNKKEKSYMIGGMILGGLSGIVGTELILDNFIDKELISLASAIGGNLLTSTFYYPISPMFGGMTIGKHFGDIFAYSSRNKRKII